MREEIVQTDFVFVLLQVDSLSFTRLPYRILDLTSLLPLSHSKDINLQSISCCSPFHSLICRFYLHNLSTHKLFIEESLIMFWLFGIICAISWSLRLWRFRKSSENRVHFGIKLSVIELKMAWFLLKVETLFSLNLQHNWIKFSMIFLPPPALFSRVWDVWLWEFFVLKDFRQVMRNNVDVFKVHTGEGLHRDDRETSRRGGNFSTFNFCCCNFSLETFLSHPRQSRTEYGNNREREKE